jgi:MFS family permease
VADVFGRRRIYLLSLVVFLIGSVLAALSPALALGLLSALGDLPAGPWWALGLALGPVGATAAIRRARVGFVRNELLPLDTPMGTVSTGPLVNAAIGPDALLLGLPALIAIAQHHPLTWTTVLIQAIVGGVGARAYISGTTSPDRVELSAPR